MRKTVCVFSVCSLALSFPLFGFGQSAPAPSAKSLDSARVARAEKNAAFSAVYPDVKIQTNPVTGVPEDLWGDLSKNQTQTDPVEAVYEFFYQNKELYGIGDPRAEIKVVRVEQDKNSNDPFGPLVVLKQIYKGVDVYQSMIKVNFNRSGKLLGIGGSFAQIPNLSTTPTVDSLSAIGIARRDLGYSDEDEKRGVEFFKTFGRKTKRPLNAWLMVAPFKDNYRLVWIVGLYRVLPFEDWEYWIDAHTGAILLEKEPRVRGTHNVPVIDTSVSPATSPKKITPVPQQKLEESTPSPNQTSGQGAQEPADPILLESKDYQQISIHQMDSIRAAQKRIADSTVKLLQPLNPSEMKPINIFDEIPGLKRAEPEEIRLERPMDSIIKDLRKRRPVEKMEKKKEEKKDSSQTNLSASTATFVNIMTEGFEGIFPENSPNWYTFDNDIPPSLNGEYYWDDDNFLPRTGGWSGWCAGGGANALPGSSNYANNMNSWMIYGPFSLTDAADAEVNFSLWLKSELNFDISWVGASPNGTTFYFSGVSGNSSTVPGNSGGWLALRLPLDSVPTGPSTSLNFLGQSNIWIAFRFTSNASIVDKGAFVDDIVLKKDALPGTPNLFANYTPVGWDGPIVVSCCPGTNKQSQPRINQPAYIDWAVINDGTRGTSTRTISRLSIDGIEVRRWAVNPPLNAGSVATVQDTTYVFTTSGLHTVTLEHDFLDAEDEISDGDNRYDYVFEIYGAEGGYNIGTGFGVLANPQNHIDTYCFGGVFRLQDFTRQLNNNLPGHNHNGQMTSFTWIETARFNSATGFVELITDPNNFWANATQAAGVDAHVYAGLTYDYLLRPHLLRNGVDGSGEGQMISVVDIPLSPSTVGAAYDTNNIVRYAPPLSGGYKSLAGSMELVAHEWGHGITHFTSRLNPGKESGALDESFSDMLGAAMSYANFDFEWYLLGEGVGPGGQPLFDLSNPLATGQADTYRFSSRGWFQVTGCTVTVNNDCGVLSNKGVPNKMFYLFANGGTHPVTFITVNGIGIDNAMKVMYLANERKWNSTTNFLQARQGSIQIADSLSPLIWGPELRKAWDAVGVCLKADMNSDGILSSSDVVRVLNCVALGLNCNQCAVDVNCNGLPTSTDIVLAMNMVFLGQSDGCPAP